MPTDLQNRYPCLISFDPSSCLFCCIIIFRVENDLDEILSHLAILSSSLSDLLKTVWRVESDVKRGLFTIGE